MDRVDILTKLLAEEFGITSSQELDRRIAEMERIDISPFKATLKKNGRNRDDT